VIDLWCPSIVIDKWRPFQAMQRALRRTVLGKLPNINAGHVDLSDGGLGILKFLGTASYPDYRN
jgi:hypothetical protein